MRFDCKCCKSTDNHPMDMNYCGTCCENYICENCIHFCGNQCEKYVCASCKVSATCKRCNEIIIYCKHCIPKHWLCYDTDSDVETNDYCEVLHCANQMPCSEH